MLVSSLKANIQLTVSLGDDLWPVLADANELELALVNVSVNARDAMPDGGRLTFTAENRTLARGEVDPELEGDFVAITATDTGVGIPQDILPRVFDPFFSTKQVGKGTGLGLSQVYGFARQSGGAVSIASEVGAGSSITLYLPRALGDLEPAAPPEAQQGAPEPARGSRVLLVEDNPEVAQVTAAMLEQLGHQVQVENGGEAALKRLDDGETFDIVFSDIVMAGSLDGLGLGRAIRERYPRVPVLLATGYTSAAEAAQGDFAILRKPYQISELSRAIAARLSDSQGAEADSKLIRFRPRPRER